VKVHRHEMGPIASKVVDQIIQTMHNDEGIEKVKVEKKKEAFSLDSDSADEDSELEGMDVNIYFIDEKSAAIHCLGNLFLFCPGPLLGRLEEISKELLNMGFYFHQNIRYHVAMTLSQLAVGFCREQTGNHDYDRKFQWEKGYPVKQPLPEKVKQFLEQVVYPHYFKIFEQEMEKEVIEKVLDAFIELCNELGPGAVDT